MFEKICKILEIYCDKMDISYQQGMPEVIFPLIVLNYMKVDIPVIYAYFRLILKKYIPGALHLFVTSFSLIISNYIVNMMIITFK